MAVAVVVWVVPAWMALGCRLTTTLNVTASAGVERTVVRARQGDDQGPSPPSTGLSAGPTAFQICW